MRINYAVEAEGLRHHVRSALGVDAGAWSRLNRRVHEWRHSLESRYAIPQSCACGRPSHPDPGQGSEVIAGGLRLIEEFAVEYGGVRVANVCLDKDDIPASGGSAWTCHSTGSTPPPTVTEVTPSSFSARNPRIGASAARPSATPTATACSKLPDWWPTPCFGGRNRKPPTVLPELLTSWTAP